MEKNFYLLLSYIFHPIFVPLYIVSICFTGNVYPFYFLNADQKTLLLGMLVINTLILPIVGIGLMKRYGIITSYLLEEKKERLYPYLYFFCLYIITATMLLFNAYAPPLLAFIYFVAGALIFTLVLMNSLAKVSAHTASMASFATIMYVLDVHEIIHMEVSVLMVILTAGLIGTARLVLKAHNLKEVSLGYACGIIVTLMASYLILP